MISNENPNPTLNIRAKTGYPTILELQGSDPNRSRRYFISVQDEPFGSEPEAVGVLIAQLGAQTAAYKFIVKAYDRTEQAFVCALYQSLTGVNPNDAR